MCFFDTIVPVHQELLDAAGIPPDPPRETRLTADYFIRQGTDGDALIAELDTPERRRAWVAAMYGHRLWASPGHFSPDDVAFMTEPFADADRLRASWGAYETGFGNRQMEDVPRLFEPCPVPTLVFYGEDDHVVDDDVPRPLPRRVPRVHRTVRAPALRPLRAVGGGRHVQHVAALVLRRPARRRFSGVGTLSRIRCG